MVMRRKEVYLAGHGRYRRSKGRPAASRSQLGKNSSQSKPKPAKPPSSKKTNLGLDLFSLLVFSRALFSSSSFFSFSPAHSPGQLAGQGRLNGACCEPWAYSEKREKYALGEGASGRRINGAYPKRAHDAEEGMMGWLPSIGLERCLGGGLFPALLPALTTRFRPSSQLPVTAALNKRPGPTFLMDGSRVHWTEEARRSTPAEAAGLVEQTQPPP